MQLVALLLGYLPTNFEPHWSAHGGVMGIDIFIPCTSKISFLRTLNFLFSFLNFTLRGTSQKISNKIFGLPISQFFMGQKL